MEPPWLPKSAKSDPLGGQMPPLRHPDGATWEPEGHPDSKNTLNVENKNINAATHQIHQHINSTSTPTPPTDQLHQILTQL